MFLSPPLSIILSPHSPRKCLRRTLVAGGPSSTASWSGHKLIETTFIKPSGSSPSLLGAGGWEPTCPEYLPGSCESVPAGRVAECLQIS
ncbi:hypothetical protein J6590_017593 [Homalodisca vitripennis]|nr:hypothetical protein J6590_017593 [Homalodisca vitripennis]